MTDTTLKKGYFIKRKNLSSSGEITIIGRRFTCGNNAEPYKSRTSAESALKQQEKQDMELCPDCIIIYDIVTTNIV